MTDESITDQRVTPEDMQQYLNLDTDGDASVLAGMIGTAEEAIIGAIDDTIDVDIYRTYPLFNQAVRVLVDFMYYSRGTLSDQNKAYPPSYAYMINSIRWKIQRDQAAKSGEADG